MADEPDLSPEAPALSGIIELARAALNSPEPAPRAETESRRQIEALMQETALSPRLLRQSADLSPRQNWWQRLWRARR